MIRVAQKHRHPLSRWLSSIVFAVLMMMAGLNPTPSMANEDLSGIPQSWFGDATLPRDLMDAVEQNDYSTLIQQLPNIATDNELASLVLGTLYLQGLGTTQDIPTAQYWFKSAIPSKGGEPEYWLAQSCDLPWTNPIDYECALTWYEQSHHKNNIRATYRWAILLNHEGSKAFYPGSYTNNSLDNYQASYDLLNSITESAEYANEPEFNTIYGLMNLWAIGTAQNLSLAEKHLTKAANQNDLYALLGMYLLHHNKMIDRANEEAAAHFKAKALLSVSETEFAALLKEFSAMTNEH